MDSVRRILVVIALLLIAKTANATPIFMGHEYDVILAEGLTWEQARIAALALPGGWDLATIGSAAENTFVENLLNTGLQERSHFWIGATDLAVEGAWQWVDATPFVFTDWWPGEPNNQSNEDYLAYDLRSGSWAWNDASPNFFTLPLVRGFVVERVAQQVPEPATLSLVGFSVLAAAAVRRRRAKRVAN